jgi:hypothetical protein
VSSAQQLTPVSYVENEAGQFPSHMIAALRAAVDTVLRANLSARLASPAEELNRRGTGVKAGTPDPG